jgi:hypothetical protein
MQVSFFQNHLSMMQCMTHEVDLGSIQFIQIDHNLSSKETIKQINQEQINSLPKEIYNTQPRKILASNQTKVFFATSYN